MPLSGNTHPYETVIWVEVGGKLAVKCGFKAHLLTTAVNYASLYAKTVTDDSGYITISDVTNNKELHRIPLGKAQAAHA